VAARVIDFASYLKYKLKILSKEFQACAVAIPVHGGTFGEDIICKLNKILGKYELPLKKVVCLVTDGFPAVSSSENDGEN
jgi:hypothetical protein